MWVLWAFGSALCAGLSSVLAKCGVKHTDSTLATALRTVVVLVMAWGIVLVTGRVGELSHLSGRSCLFLILSGAATGLSWLCYYRALQLGRASQVVPVDKFSVVIALVLAFAVLHEPMDVKTVLGALLITAGTLVMIL